MDVKGNIGEFTKGGLKNIIILTEREWHYNLFL
jgi:hypothetical protein